MSLTEPEERILGYCMAGQVNDLNIANRKFCFKGRSRVMATGPDRLTATSSSFGNRHPNAQTH